MVTTQTVGMCIHSTRSTTHISSVERLQGLENEIQVSKCMVTVRKGDICWTGCGGQTSPRDRNKAGGVSSESPKTNSDSETMSWVERGRRAVSGV